MISMLTNLFFKWVETSTYEYLFEMASFFWRSGIVSFRECISVGEKRVLKLFFSFWFTDVHGKMVAILKFPGVHHPISSQNNHLSDFLTPKKASEEYGTASRFLGCI